MVWVLFFCEKMLYKVERMWKEFMKTKKVRFTALGYRIEQIRVDHDLTKEEFANICNISLSTYYRIIQGNKNPDSDILESIWNHFKQSPDWIILGRRSNFSDEEKQMLEGLSKTQKQTNEFIDKILKQ